MEEQQTALLQNSSDSIVAGGYSGTTATTTTTTTSAGHRTEQDISLDIDETGFNSATIASQTTSTTPTTNTSMTGSKKSKFDGLLPLAEEQSRDRLRFPLTVLGAVQLVACMAFAIGLRVLMFKDKCGSPVMFKLPLDFAAFKESNGHDLCKLGYYVLGFTTTALSVLMAQGILGIVNSRWMHYYFLLVGIFFFGFCSFGLIGITITVLATGFPFFNWSFPVILLTAINLMCMFFALKLKPFYQKMKAELDARAADAEDSQMALTEQSHVASDP